ncbi:MAG: S-layer homology domain-containing protein, partial [Oscillospiraceae bacterium]|nr:S-layer homology domain-containing protein [Oscillospiraceae bacterium]
TREQLAVILANYARSAQIPLGAGGASTFTDGAQISPWAREAVRLLAEANIIKGTGNGSFSPGKAATRAEVAALLSRFEKNIIGQQQTSR